MIAALPPLLVLALAFSSTQAASFSGLHISDISPGDSDHVVQDFQAGDDSPKVVDFDLTGRNRLRVQFGFFANYSSPHSLEDYLRIWHVDVVSATCADSVRTPAQVQIFRKVMEANLGDAGDIEQNGDIPIFTAPRRDRLGATLRGSIHTDSLQRKPWRAREVIYDVQIKVVPSFLTTHAHAACFKYSQLAFLFSDGTPSGKREARTDANVVLRVIKKRNTPVDVPDIRDLVESDFSTAKQHKRKHCVLCREKLLPSAQELAELKGSGGEAAGSMPLANPCALSLLATCGHAFHSECLSRHFEGKPANALRCVCCHEPVELNSGMFSSFVNLKELRNGESPRITWAEIEAASS